MFARRRARALKGQRARAGRPGEFIITLPYAYHRCARPCAYPGPGGGGAVLSGAAVGALSSGLAGMWAREHHWPPLRLCAEAKGAPPRTGAARGRELG